jgi:hypothetical protein
VPAPPPPAEIHPGCNETFARCSSTTPQGIGCPPPFAAVNNTSLGCKNSLGVIGNCYACTLSTTAGDNGGMPGSAPIRPSAPTSVTCSVPVFSGMPAVTSTDMMALQNPQSVTIGQLRLLVLRMNVPESTKVSDLLNTCAPAPF